MGLIRTDGPYVGPYSSASESHSKEGAGYNREGPQALQEAEVILALLVEGSVFVTSVNTSVLVVLSAVHSVPLGETRVHCCLGPSLVLDQLLGPHWAAGGNHVTKSSTTIQICPYHPQHCRVFRKVLKVASASSARQLVHNPGHRQGLKAAVGLSWIDLNTLDLSRSRKSLPGLHEVIKMLSRQENS